MAFKDCKELTSAHLPGLEAIPNNAFQCSGNSQSLTEVSMPMAKSIGSGAFLQCAKLASAPMPKVEKVSYNAFMQTALTSAIMPLVNDIGEEAFYKIVALTEVSLPLRTSVEKDSFRNSNNIAIVTPPRIVLPITGGDKSPPLNKNDVACCKADAATPCTAWCYEAVPRTPPRSVSVMLG